MAIEEAEESDDDIDDELAVENRMEMSTKVVNRVQWIGNPDFVQNGKSYYKKAKVGML